MTGKAPEQEVILATFRYRHEAELAAGFLLDAGIPYRLQIDDAGGVDFGTTFSRPPVLWVRAADEAEARELLELDQDSPSPADEEMR
jgi:hypothetical protein